METANTTWKLLPPTQLRAMEEISSMPVLSISTLDSTLISQHWHIQTSSLPKSSLKGQRTSKTWRRWLFTARIGIGILYKSFYHWDTPILKVEKLTFLVTCHAFLLESMEKDPTLPRIVSRTTITRKISAFGSPIGYVALRPTSGSRMKKVLRWH